MERAEWRALTRAEKRGRGKSRARGPTVPYVSAVNRVTTCHRGWLQERGEWVGASHKKATLGLLRAGTCHGGVAPAPSSPPSPTTLLKAGPPLLSLKKERSSRAFCGVERHTGAAGLGHLPPRKSDPHSRKKGLGAWRPRGDSESDGPAGSPRSARFRSCVLQARHGDADSSTRDL